MTGTGREAGVRPQVSVVDYGIGNLRSAEKGLQRAGADARLTDDPDEIAAAEGMVLPGVGAFGATLAALERTGLGRVVVEAASQGTPLLGICVGAQALFEGSEEAPGMPGLGLLPGTIRRLPSGVRHPQMQWNRLHVHRPDHPLMAALPEECWMYFVHSFAPVTDPGLVLATCDYGGEVTAAVADGRVAAAQFHPEKSGDHGRAFVSAFVQSLGATV